MTTKAEGRDAGRIVAILVFLLILAGLLFVYASNRTAQANLYDSFVEARYVIADGGLNKYRQTLNNEYGHLFRDCEDRALYDQYIDSDSRNMTAAELSDALDLHPACSHFLVATNQFIVEMLGSDIEHLRALSELFSNSTKRKNAQVVVSYWDTVFEQEKERAIIFERLVDIQEEYWQHDLDKSLGTISSEEREAAVGALNFEASEKLAKTEELIETLNEERRQENLFWSESFGKRD